jgi:hypothetical protein
MTASTSIAFKEGAPSQATSSVVEGAPLAGAAIRAAIGRSWWRGRRRERSTADWSGTH